MRNTVRREDENSKRKPPVMNCTPKIRQKKSNFWGVFIRKLTYDDKVQIYELRKQGYSLENLSKFKTRNDS